MLRNRELDFKGWWMIAVFFGFCFCVLAALFPKIAFADEHKHPVCGANHTDIGDHIGSCSDVVWSAWNGNDLDLASEGLQLVSGSYYLSDDVTLEQTVVIPQGATVSLCLNGHVLNGGGAVQVLHVEPGATLNICDCNSSQTHGFTVHSNGRWILDDSNPTEILAGGAITNGCAKGTAGELFNVGGGICINSATLNLFGGNVVGNQSDTYQAGGVDVYASTFKMYGGMIVGNYAEGSGGGVYIGKSSSDRASFALYSGSIIDNVATARGGGVAVMSDSFVMTDGVIAGNYTHSSGGGIYLNSYTTFRMSGGEVTNNIAKSYGGGVFVSSGNLLDLSGSCNISDNKCLESGSNNEFPEDIYLGQNVSTYVTAIIGVSDALTGATSALPKIVVASAFEAGPVVKGIYGSQGDLYSVTDEDMKRFHFKALDVNPNQYSLLSDEVNNQYVIGKDASDMVVEPDSSPCQFVYNGQSQKPSVVVKLYGVTLEENDYFIEWPDDVTNAGQKTLTVVGAQAAPNYYVGQITCDYSIVPKSIEPNINGVKESYVYNGDSIQPEIAVYDGDTLLEQDRDYTVTYGENETAAEDGWIKVTLKGNYSGSVYCTFDITKAPTYYSAPNPCCGLVYDGTQHNLLEQGKVTQGGTMLYSLSEQGPYTDTVPVATDAGDYTVWYKVDGGVNYEGVEPKAIDVSITPQQLSILSARASNRDYDGDSEVAIEDIVLNDICNTDSVWVDCAQAKGMLVSAHAGEYSSISLSQLSLVGEDARNYVIYSEDLVPLSVPVIISPIKVSRSVDHAVVSGDTTEQSVSLLDISQALQGYLPCDEAGLVYSLDSSYDTSLFDSVSVSDGVLVFQLKHNAPVGLHSNALTIQVAGMTNYSEVLIAVDVVVESIPQMSEQQDGGATNVSGLGVVATGDDLYKVVGVVAALLLISGIIIGIALRRR